MTKHILRIMINDQITALAREYAEERASMMQGSLTTKIQAELVIRFLLRRYALVEKSKLLKEYESAKHDSKMAHRERLYTMLAVASARKALLESLFPDLGKEVEG